MKTVRRVLAVVLLIAAVLAVGYLCYTGSRLAETTRKASEQCDRDITVPLCDGDDGIINF